jgi:hypothetical protein
MLTRNHAKVANALALVEIARPLGLIILASRISAPTHPRCKTWPPPFGRGRGPAE